MAKITIKISDTENGGYNVETNLLMNEKSLNNPSTAQLLAGYLVADLRKNRKKYKDIANNLRAFIQKNLEKECNTGAD